MANCLLMALVGTGGFEPPKLEATDLQSVPFGHSGISPPIQLKKRAEEGTRTPDQLITNQLLYQLSYSGFFYLKELPLLKGMAKVVILFLSIKKNNKKIDVFF